MKLYLVGVGSTAVRKPPRQHAGDQDVARIAPYSRTWTSTLRFLRLEPSGCIPKDSYKERDMWDDNYAP